MESLDEGRIGTEAWRENLKCDGAVKGNLTGLVNSTHSPFGDLFEKFESRNDFAFKATLQLFPFHLRASFLIEDK